MKKTKKVIMMLITALLIMAVPASAQAAFKVTKSGVSLPSTIKKGATFQMKGTLKANEKMTKIKRNNRHRKWNDTDLQSGAIR